MKPLRQHRALPMLYKLMLILCLCTLLTAPALLSRMTASADGKQTGKPQSPTVSNTISGTVTYYDPNSALTDCAGVPAKPLSNVTVQTTSGSPSGSSNTGAPPSTGNYSITGLGSGPYTVAPSRPDQTAPDPAISTTDATRVLQFVAATITLNPCQQTAADASGNGSVTSTDATRVLQYVAGVSSAPNPNISGSWKFSPASRTYVTLLSDQTGQNYSGVMVGDVTGNGSPTSPQAKPAAPLANIAVSLPTITTPANTVATLTIPVTVGNLTGLGVTDYAFTVSFDATKIQPSGAFFSTAGTLSSGMTVVPNAGTTGQLRIAAAQVNNLTGSGTLINLIFQTASIPPATPPQFTNLTFTAFDFGESGNTPSPLTNGRVTFFTPTSVAFHDCAVSAYDNGSVIEWQTGYEADNLGFNIYREEGGKRTLVNSNLIAGSALKAKSALGAGEAYAWWDDSPTPNASYWIEDVDLNGKSTWNGPFYARQVGGAPPERSRAALLSNLGNRSKDDTTTVIENRSPVNERGRLASTESHAVIESGRFSYASEPSFKISTKGDGWYRITQPELVAAGLNPNVNPATLQLFVDGREIPMTVSTSGGSFDGQAAIEFYATSLNTPATDTHTYWLVAGNQTGLRIPLLKSDGAPTANRTYMQTVERRDRTLYFSALLNGDTENFFGAVVNNNPVDQSITLLNVDKTEATLQVALQGVSNNAHRVTAFVNGFVAGDVVFDARQRGVGNFTIPGSFLRDGANTVSLVAQNGQQDVSLIDYLRISYPHTYNADNDYLSFTATGRERITIDGFTSKQIRVFDVTDSAAVKELQGFVNSTRNRFNISFTAADNGTRNLIATTQGQSKRASRITANQPSSWRTANHAADLVIITRGDLASAIEPLRAARQQEGYRVAVVDVEDLYDEFTFGNKAPQAIRDFLGYARASWSVAPRFVLFAGDATFDPKNYLGFGDNDALPTKLIDTAEIETASDDWFSDFNNDGIADLAMGRLPVRSVAEANSVVAKLLRYGSSQGSGAALLVSDLNDGFSFEQENANLRPLLTAKYQIQEVKRGELGDQQARAQLLTALNGGPRIVNYYGHGSIGLLRGNLLTSDDAATLNNYDNLSLFTLMNCLNGYFQDISGNSLAEALLKANGGAAAVWTSTGLTFPNEQARMNQQLYTLLLGDSRNRLTLGEAIQQAKAITSDSDVRKTWVLLGDPTTRIK